MPGACVDKMGFPFFERAKEEYRERTDYFFVSIDLFPIKTRSIISLSPAIQTIS